LESAQAGKLRENYCNNDKSSAVKLARCYLTGRAKKVWQPDEQTQVRRELYFAYERAAKNSTRCRNQIKGFLNQHCIRCPKRLSLTKPAGLHFALQVKQWSPLQRIVLASLFDSLIHAETQRKTLSRQMCIEIYNDKQLKQLMRLMGVAHIIAFAIGAFVADIERFATAKKLVGYFGLAPRKTQSGNNIEGRKGGIGNSGRKQIRTLLIQSAQNAMQHKSNPLHKWGWKLIIKKNRNLALAAVARKIATAIWHLLKGHYTPLKEASDSIMNKIRKISVEIGPEFRQELGFSKLNLFCEHFFQTIKVNT
jgi:transposase